MRQQKRILFLLFFISGLCGLLYQLVWLRLAFAAFGVITPVVSVVVSIFMFGLSVGSWAGGRLIDRSTKKSPLFFYGITELGIALGALVVPRVFDWQRGALLRMGESSSTSYLATSALAIALALLPWCLCMGATYPLVMAYWKKKFEETDSFSFLYLANVLGAVVGTLLTAFVFVELLGFRNTLLIGCGLNIFIAAVSFFLASQDRQDEPAAIESQNLKTPVALSLGRAPISPSLVFIILFVTGFISTAMEVVWTRAFTPITQTTIYAFALLLSTYLVATAFGSHWYRRQIKAGRTYSLETLFFFLSVAAFLPLILTDPRLRPQAIHVILGLFPLCAGLGYLTPLLIDNYAKGAARAAGAAYAVNIIGCILGPLLSGYVLLPIVGVKTSLLVLAAPCLALLLITRLRSGEKRDRRVGTGATVLSVALALFCTTYEDGKRYDGAVIHRDSVATTIAHGKGKSKSLIVNGIGITHITPITKMMAHLPLFVLSTPPRSVLIICFGMGTTFRSALSWGADVTAVELVPGVRSSFGYFFDDAGSLLESGRAHIVVDDGRRFLSRTTKKFDVITLDPPPPVEAAGSSLLYSTEFYDLVRRHLTSHGILQQWFPGGEEKILQAVAGSIKKSFPYIKVLRSNEGWGYHFLASESPFEIPTVAQVVARMPDAAKRDLLEWEEQPRRAINQLVAEILKPQLTLAEVSDPHEKLFITDDQPFNEYSALRRGISILGGGRVRIAR